MSVYRHDNRRVVHRFMGVTLIIIAVVMMMGLYYVKIRAQSAKSSLARLEQAVIVEENAVSILRVELAYLQSPDRLQNLSETYLGLAPISVKKTHQVSDIDTLFEFRELSEEDVSREYSGAKPGGAAAIITGAPK